MKINKNNFDLSLFINQDDYDGNFRAFYTDKILDQEVNIEADSVVITLNESETQQVEQLKKMIIKPLNSKGFKFQKIVLLLSPTYGTIETQFMVGETMNYLGVELSKDSLFAKKALQLCRAISKRMLKELR